MREKKVGMIWGVGKEFEEKMEREGIRKIGKLKKMEEGEMMKEYGKMGKRIYRM